MKNFSKTLKIKIVNLMKQKVKNKIMIKNHKLKAKWNQIFKIMKWKVK